MEAPFAAWIDRDVVRASGPDTAAFLQGQLSQDVSSLAVGASTWSLLLQPAGKVDAWLRVARTSDVSYELDVDTGWGEAVTARLRRFLLRTKCELELAPAQRVLAVRGTEVDGGRSVVWPGTVGSDLFAADDDNRVRDVPIVDAASYERARIRAGVPALGRELTERTIPVEAGQWLIDASVSFTKGCYTGQELVARVDARGGNAPRPVRGLLAAVGAFAEGSELRDVDDKVIGAITSAAGDVALAPLPRTVDIGARVRAGDVDATVVPLPMT